MRFSLPLALILVALTPGCKQGEGERCQIDDDCTSGLVCSESQHICVPIGGGTPDGMLIIDARPDGPPPDAGLDAAPVDASDASVVDGLLPDVI